jgi:putative endonuclease
MDTKELGDLGEKLACEYLVDKGYKILGRNCMFGFGEIDIIAQKKFRWFEKRDKTIHFVEVKTSFAGNKTFFPEQRFDNRKQNKYRKLSELWMTKNKMPENTPYQIDVVAIAKADQSPEIIFFENAVAG